MCETIYDERNQVRKFINLFSLKGEIFKYLKKQVQKEIQELSKFLKTEKLQVNELLKKYKLT